MANAFDVINAEEESKTRDQFKVFQFCSQIKNGVYNFDLIANSKRQYTIQNIKDVEFMSLSP